MLYDYFEEGNGYVSLWLGNFKEKQQLDDYTSTVYMDTEIEVDISFEEKLAQLFLPENKNRVEEDSLKELFDEIYNQFEYDFGLSFDSDFLECSFSIQPNSSLSALLTDHSYFTSFSALFPQPTNKSYTSVILVYDCRYDGHRQSVQHADSSVTFIGAVPYKKDDA